MTVKRDTSLKWPIIAVKSWAFPAFNEANLAGAQTGYFCYWGSYVAAGSAEVQLPKTRITKVRIHIITNTTTSASTLTLLRNGAATGITGNIAAAATGFFEFTGNEEYQEGDRMAVQIDIGGTPAHALYVRGGTIVMEA